MKIAYFFCSVFLLPAVLNAQTNSSPAWTKLAGGNHDTHCSVIEPVKEGGYILAGGTTATNGDVSGNHGGMDAWLVRLDGAGNIVWQKCLGGSGYDFAYDIKETATGNFIVAAATSSQDGDVTGNHGDTDIWIINIDNTGNLISQKCFGGSKIDIPNSLQVTPDGGYIFTASTNSTDGDIGSVHPDTCYWCAKIDNTGSIAWNKPFNGAAFLSSSYSFSPEANPLVSFSYAYVNTSHIENTADGGFIISAQADTTAGGALGGADYLLLKLAGNGQLVWQKVVGSAANDIAITVKPTGNGYVLTGNTAIETNVAPFGDKLAPQIIRLDADGNEIWRMIDTFNTTPHNEKAVATIARNTTIAGNHDLITTGYIITAGFGQMPVAGWITRIDSLGNPMGVTYRDDVNALYDVKAAGDSGFIAAGDFYNLQSGDTPESTYVAKAYVADFNASLLPVTNLNLTAAKKDGDVLLHWQTSTEINSSYFIVERSIDGINFKNLGEVSAAGNSNQPRNYSYTDYTLKTTASASGVLYYRLQETDKDGKVTMSKIAKVINQADMSLLAAPNPAKNVLALHINGYTGKAIFNVFDMAGHKVAQTEGNVSGTGTVFVSIARLPAGTYIASTLLNGKVTQVKFIKD